MIGGEETPANEPRQEPKYVETESADVQMPKAGEMLSAVITKLGMTTAAEQFGKDAQARYWYSFSKMHKKESQGEPLLVSTSVRQ